MHPLDGPRLKVRRAESEIDTLKLSNEAYTLESDYQIFRAELDSKTGNRRYRILINSPAPSLDWGVSIGEIAHNLRSALDGLVHQLALLKTNAPASQTQFPIFLKGITTQSVPGRKKQLRPHFEGKGFGGGRFFVRSLRDCHQTLIERLQPYKRGGGGLNNPLYWLKEINNADKHRLIQVVGARWIGGPAMTGSWGDDAILEFMFRRRRGAILENGAIFGETSDAHDVHVYSKIMVAVAFSDGCPPVKGLHVTNTLSIIHEQVSEIIESFVPEF
jgi:hypothetical protein